MTKQNKASKKTISPYSGWVAVSSIALSGLGASLCAGFGSTLATFGQAQAAFGVQDIKKISITEAQTASFMGLKVAKFEEFPLNLTDDILNKISQKSGIRVQKQDKLTQVWRAVDAKNQKLGWFLVDKVYGKHEFITYSVALDASGMVLHIEIIDYRESYGGEVSQDSWRMQFVGKKLGDTLTLDGGKSGDIKNISGATLSCKHVSDGVKRMLALHDTLLRN